MYKGIIRPILFKLAPEQAHRLIMDVLHYLHMIPFVPFLLKILYHYHDPRIAVSAFGLTFKNPMGLAAGFDKDGKYIEVLESLGFGFIELGTVTPKAQSGNPKPRLFRLKKDQALINRMGFNNEGVDALVHRLKKLKNRDIVIGGNIGKNKTTPIEDAHKDYVVCFEKLHAYVDYFVVNVSSPNTPGLRTLQEKGPLNKILSALQKRNNALSDSKPLLLKIAPDLNERQLDDIAEIVLINKVDGIIISNTTIARSQLKTDPQQIDRIGKGGLSGAPLRNQSNNVLQYMTNRTKSKIPIIAVGGIFTIQDVLSKKKRGACLYQVYTGYIYEGPAMIKKILKGLSAKV